MTTNSEDNSASRVANEILEGKKTAGETPPSPDRKSRAGRPNKSGKTWPKKKSRRSSETSTAPAEPPELTDADVAAYAQLGGFAWMAASNVWGLEPLNDEERTQLGTALAHVANKYAPMLGPYMPEFNLGVLVVGLVMTKQRKKGEKDETPFELPSRDGLSGM